MEISSRMKNLLNTMNLIMNDKIPERDINYWEWNSGVGLFGVSEAYERTNDADYIKFIREWFDKNGGDDRYRGSVNCVIPCYAALTLYRADRDERCLSVCDEYADWAQNVSIKTKNGGIAHVDKKGNVAVSQIVDSDDFDACCLASELHAALQGVLGQGEDAAVRFQSIKLLEVVLYLITEKVWHLDHAVAFLRFRRGDNVLAL